MWASAAPTTPDFVAQPEGDAGSLRGEHSGDGPAKSSRAAGDERHLVRELDVFDGLMARAADRAAIEQGTV